MLELERVSKRYESPGEQIRAVDRVSMGVDAGEFVAILGPSGSGKTTLLLLTAGLLRADSGTVLFDGRDLGGLAKRDVLAYRRRQLGFVFQDFNLSAGLTAGENVAIPLLLRGVAHRDAHKRALSALDDVGLLRRAGHTPKELSGGE
jgi:putative ABC transport system ATP-binding protein